MGCKNEDITLGGVQHDNNNSSYLSSDNNSKSECENNAGKKGEDNAGKKDKNNADKKSKNNIDKKGEDNTSGKSEDDNDEKSENDIGRNGETLNIKLKLRDGDEISNLGEIAADKLVFCFIANLLVDIPVHGTVILDYFIISLIVILISLVSGFFILSSTAPGFPASDYPILGPPFLLVLGLPAFPLLSLSVIPLVNLDDFFHNLFFAFIVNGGIIKFLMEVITNLFGNNSFIIAHPFHNGCTSKQAPGMSFEFKIANLLLGVNTFFNI